ncbi:MAG: hypothetical protein HDS71_08880 [Bacteroidales bacterium]|nr:hypothetical protein [Bacteroidales bacterium]MBD5205183.1 hypothetical protein [Bacteroidales bacterium]MBD5224138.1 hypothetical protein [Bacteroidales bacterium]
MSKANIFFICSLIIACLTFFSSCRGSAGKKAAKDVLELIEKKAGSKAATAIEREAAQTERTVVRETEEYNAGRSRSARRRHHSSHEDDDSYHQPQVYSVQCRQCGGAGAVYMVDYYGNIQYDYYGNPMVSQCPSCGGSGAILVSE